MGNPILASRCKHTWQFDGAEGKTIRWSRRQPSLGEGLGEGGQTRGSPSSGIDVGQIWEKAWTWRSDTWRAEEGLVVSLQESPNRLVSRFHQKPRAVTSRRGYTCRHREASVEAKQSVEDIAAIRWDLVYLSGFASTGLLDLISVLRVF